MTRVEAPVEITVYTLPWCIHCARAKALLRRRGLDFREVDGSAVPQFRRQLVGLTGSSTVPQIVIDGKPAGGADRLAGLDRLGVLAAIADGERFPIVRDIRRVSPRSLFRWAVARLRGRNDVSAAMRIQVAFGRAGQVVAIDDEPTGETAKEARDGKGLRRTTG